jgi:hypothetical protein
MIMPTMAESNKRSSSDETKEKHTPQQPIQEVNQSG